MNKKVKKLLTKKQKERLCYLHWNLGTLFEDEYYQDLMTENDELKNIYEITLKETLEELKYDYDDYISLDEDDYDYDEIILLHMQKLDKKLKVGLYDYDYN